MNDYVGLLIICIPLLILFAVLYFVLRDYNPKGDISYITGKPVDEADLSFYDDEPQEDERKIVVRIG